MAKLKPSPAHNIHPSEFLADIQILQEGIIVSKIIVFITIQKRLKGLIASPQDYSATGMLLHGMHLRLFKNPSNLVGSSFAPLSLEDPAETGIAEADEESHDGNHHHSLNQGEPSAAVM